MYLYKIKFRENTKVLPGYGRNTSYTFSQIEDMAKKRGYSVKVISIKRVYVNNGKESNCFDIISLLKNR